MSENITIKLVKVWVKDNENQSWRDRWATNA